MIPKILRALYYQTNSPLFCCLYKQLTGEMNQCESKKPGLYYFE